jgi:hypothetical protein
MNKTYEMKLKAIHTADKVLRENQSNRKNTTGITVNRYKFQSLQNLIFKITQMKINFLLPALMSMIGYPVFSQTKIPVIKATSEMVDIRDGSQFKQKAWHITPRLRPDVYTTSDKHTKVTFYTDTDSISFKIKPHKTFTFVILLNDKDSAFTQVKYEQAKSGPDYLETLKKARKYDLSDHRKILDFLYESEKSTELIKLREKFNLDSIAGKGNEQSKILNLLHWVHNSFVYDGTKDVPDHIGTADLMSKCMNGRGTMHCGALAWVLNDCYLAMGFKSRHVVCLPKDSVDFDCHSINTVFSKTQHKWLWIDPTNDAYVMNEKGDLLSIAEVRERLINNKPLILNPEANLNRSASIGKNYYLQYYMAKNLYAFQCFVPGGGESKSNLLLPVEYKGIIPRTKMNHPKCTTNPSVFWANPE